MSGWIKLHRKLTEWEWYSDVNTSRVFLHLLLVANHKDNQWRGINIKRGERLTSLSKLATETNLSVKNIRTSIKRLKATSEVASYSTAQHTVFTVVNYDLYQDVASEVANEGQANGKQRATNKNDKECKNDKDPISWVNIKAAFNESFSERQGSQGQLLEEVSCSVMTDKRKALIKKLMKEACINQDEVINYIKYAGGCLEFEFFRVDSRKSGGKFAHRPFDWYFDINNFIRAKES